MQANIVNSYPADSITVLGLAQNETSLDWLKNYIVQMGLTFDLLYQADEVFHNYGVYYNPTYILIDQEGQIVYRISDYLSFGNIELYQKIQALLGSN